MREHKLNENIHVDSRSDDRSDIAPGRLYQLSEPTVSCDVSSLGQDLWRQLKRVQIPVFSGDKRSKKISNDQELIIPKLEGGVSGMY